MKKILLLLFLFCSIQTFGQKSALAEGEWLKVKISSSGVYKIDLAFLKKNYAGYKNIDPKKVQVFAGNLAVLPQNNDADRVKDLVEIPTETNDTDGKLDTKDQILFYASDPHFVGFDSSKNRYVHKLNPYDSFNYYFIKIGEEDSRKIKEISTQTTNNQTYSTLDFYYYHENEIKNVLNSGREWMGEFFYNSADFEIENTDAVGQILLNVNILGIGRANQTLDLKLAEESLKKVVLPASEYNSADNYARYNRYSNFSSFEINYQAKSNKTPMKLSLSTENSANAGAYLDYFDVQFSRKIRFFPKNQTHFYHKKQSARAQFQISDFSANAGIWKVDNLYQVESIKPNENGIFSCETAASISKFIVFDKNEVPNPIFVEKVVNQNINSNIVPELLIIYPKKFKSEVERLVVHKKQVQNLEVLSLTTDEVYNEYSSGKTDPTAIRDVCRFFWKKNPNKFKHLLLFGDASFDFKNNNGATYLDIKNLVPTYQSKESLEPIYSYSSDDYFGFLEDQEGDWEEGFSKNNVWISNRTNDHTMDISVGRLPAKTLLEAKNIVNKIINYQFNDKNGGDWKNKLAFVADNRDYNIHQNDAEKLSELAISTNGGFEIQKIYLDNYPILTNGQLLNAPAATSALNYALNNGSYIVNYNGHGSEDGWAQEKLLTVGDILNWRNSTKLPIFFTATCQFGKFDNPALVSGAELALLNPSGGCIAMLTTTRPVYSSTNEKINRAFYQNLTKAKTLGELFRLTKNGAIEGEINRNFSLLGDPSQILPNWTEDLKITESNNKKPEGQVWKALEKITIIGESKSISNGKIKIRIFDKPKQKKTLGTYADGPPYEYSEIDNLLFEGIFTIQKGAFTGDIILPKDQILGIGKGQLTMFAISEDSTEKSYGYFNEFQLTNENSQIFPDNSPPEVTVTLNSSNTLVFEVYDENGINLSDFEPNHTIMLVINDTLKIIGNPYYIPKESGQWGQIKYFVGALPEGNHSIKLIVFDSYNNKTEKTFDFKIAKPSFTISSFLNYPNPFSNYTNLIFKHNRLGDDILAHLVIFDIYGNSVMGFQKECKKCEEKIDFGLDFEGKTSIGTTLFFKISLLSKTENESTQASGKLLFWK